MLEEWAWDADVLRTFATNAAGEPIPADAGRRRCAPPTTSARAYAARTQMFYASVSYFLHQDASDRLRTT